MIILIFLLLFISTAQANTRDGLVLWWKLNETSGTTALDSSRNGITGTLTSGPTRALGKDNNGVKFDGSDDVIVSASNSLLELDSNRTMALWLNINSHSGTYKTILSIGQLSCCGVEYYINHDDEFSSNKIFVQHSGRTGQTGAITVTPGLWAHIAWTYDGTTSKIYVNGVQDVSAAMSPPVSEYSDVLHAGAGEGPTRPMTGILDDIRVYNRALSAKEVKDLYNSGVREGYAPGT